MFVVKMSSSYILCLPENVKQLCLPENVKQRNDANGFLLLLCICM